MSDIANQLVNKRRARITEKKYEEVYFKCSNKQKYEDVNRYVEREIEDITAYFYTGSNENCWKKLYLQSQQLNKEEFNLKELKKQLVKIEKMNQQQAK